MAETWRETQKYRKTETELAYVAYSVIQLTIGGGTKITEMGTL